MTHMLKSLANGKIVLALEVKNLLKCLNNLLNYSIILIYNQICQGGYNLNSLSSCALACVKVLLGEPPGKLEKLRPRKECMELIHQVIRTQSKYWRTLVPQYVNISEGNCHIMIFNLFNYTNFIIYLLIRKFTQETYC